MTCTHCERLPGPHILLDPDGSYALCWACIVQLLPEVERGGARLVLSVEPAVAAL